MQMMSDTHLHMLQLLRGQVPWKVGVRVAPVGGALPSPVGGRAGIAGFAVALEAVRRHLAVVEVVRPLRLATPPALLLGGHLPLLAALCGCLAVAGLHSIPSHDARQTTLF